MKLLCYSDIHHAALYPGGITEEDIAAVEERFTNIAVERKVDATLFNGDRFLSHTPEDWVRVYADKAQRRRNDLGIVNFSLVGNHDWWGKTHIRGHSNRQAQQVWGDLLPNLVVMDEPKTYRHPSVPGLHLHALPAEFEPDLSLYDFSEGGIHILAFHACLKGALLDDETDYRSPTGIPLSAIDDPRFTLVLGGDLHIPQKLPFKNTVGGYVGAAIQQTRRDRGENRQFLLIDTDTMDFEFIDTGCPRFFDLHVSVENGQIDQNWVLQALQAAEEDPARTILSIFVHGPRQAVETYKVPDMTGLVRSVMAIRRIPSQKKKVSVVKAPEVTTPLESFEGYLKVDGVNLQGLSSVDLLSKAKEVL